MKTASFLAVAETLYKARVGYIVVGGFIIIAHGYLRATRDANTALELVPENIQSGFDTLSRGDTKASKKQ